MRSGPEAREFAADGRVQEEQREETRVPASKFGDHVTVLDFAFLFRVGHSHWSFANCQQFSGGGENDH